MIRTLSAALALLVLAWLALEILHPCTRWEWRADGETTLLHQADGTVVPVLGPGYACAERKP